MRVLADIFRAKGVANFAVDAHGERFAAPPLMGVRAGRFC
jgi:hypothetical protein